MSKVKFTCTQCKKEIVFDTANGVGTGYGTYYVGDKICYPCCGINDENRLLGLGIGEKMSLYFDEDGIKNWPGTFHIPRYKSKVGNHNIAGNREDVWFNYFNKKTNERQYYWGVVYGDWTEICHIKRVKGV